MKYIRTKDGIFEWNTLLGISQEYFENNKKEIIVQADTIEELCDSFVIFYNKSHHKVSILKSMTTARLYYKRDKRYSGNYVDKVYGAIWTDKGLIYVAKMNEEGELELL